MNSGVWHIRRRDFSRATSAKCQKRNDVKDGWLFISDHCPPARKLRWRKFISCAMDIIMESFICSSKHICNGFKHLFPLSHVTKCWKESQTLNDLPSPSWHEDKSGQILLFPPPVVSWPGYSFRWLLRSKDQNTMSYKRPRLYLEVTASQRVCLLRKALHIRLEGAAWSCPT